MKKSKKKQKRVHGAAPFKQGRTTREEASRVHGMAKSKPRSGSKVRSKRPGIAGPKGDPTQLAAQAKAQKDRLQFNKTVLQHRKKTAGSLKKAYSAGAKRRIRASQEAYGGMAGMFTQAATLGASLAEALARTMEQFVVLAKKGALSTGLAFQMLGKAMLKATLQSLGQSILTQSILDLSMGAALVAGIYTAAQGLRYLIAGGLEGAAAGVFFGLSMAYLAEGGLVTQPTLAMLGEGGQPELVVPQSKLSSVEAFSIQAKHLRAVFPDMEDPAAARHPGFEKKFQINLQAALASAVGSSGMA